MQAPKEHLAYLVKLAGDPAATGGRAELLRQLGALLTAWPANYPVEARSSFAALLARVERDADPDSRRELALSLAWCPDAPLGLLKEFFFDIPSGARERILSRANDGPASAAKADELALIAAARAKRGSEFTHALAAGLGIDILTAIEILQDGTGTGLAIACRGAGLSRVAFSTLAVLAMRGDPAKHRLVAYETVPDRGAAAMLAFWRQQTAHQSRAA